MMEILLCPESIVYYGLSNGDMILSSVLICFVTLTFGMFISNFFAYKNKMIKNSTMIFSLFLMIFMTVLNIITFLFYIKPEEKYMSGVTSTINILDSFLPLICVLMILGSAYITVKICYREKGG